MLGWNAANHFRIDDTFILFQKRYIRHCSTVLSLDILFLGCFSATVPDSFAVFIDATTELPQPCRFATLAHLCACIDSSTSLPDLSTAESLTIQDQNHISATIFPPSAIFLYLSCIICIVSYQFTLAILLLYVGQSPRLLTRYLVFTTINATEPEAEPDLTDIPKPLRETLQELKDLLEFEDLSPETRAWVSERLDHM